MTNPNTHNQHNESPEMERALETAYERITGLRIGRLNKHERKRLSEVLGRKNLKENVSASMLRIRNPKVNAGQIRNIYSMMAKNRAGIYAMIPPEARKENFNLLTSSGSMALSSLVRDPNSKEAHVLAWFYNNTVHAGNVDEFSDIFDTVDKVQVNDAEKLAKIATLVSKILDEKKYQSLGEPGTIDRRTTPPTIAGGSGKMLAKQQEMLKAQEEAERALRKQTTTRTSAAGSGSSATRKKNTQVDEVSNPQYFLDRANEAKNEFKEMSDSRTALIADLQSLRQTVGGLDGISTNFTDADVNAIAANAGSLRGHSVLTGFNVDLQTSAGNKSIDAWINDGDLPSLATSLRERFKQSGTGQPPARLALRELLKRQFSNDLDGFSEDEQKHFYNEMIGTLTSTTSVVESVATRSEDVQASNRGSSGILGTTWKGVKEGYAWTKWFLSRPS